MTQPETELQPGKKHVLWYAGAAVIWTILAVVILLWGGFDKHSVIVVTTLENAAGGKASGIVVPFVAVVMFTWLLVACVILLGWHRVTTVSRMLHESEERHRQQLQKSLAVMLIVNPANGAVVEANPSACRFYGYSHEVFLQTSIFEFNCAGAEVVRKSMDEVREAGALQFQSCHRGADGSVKDVEVFGSLTTIGGVKLLHLIVFDITSRLNAERQLRDKMDFAENLLQNATTPTFVIDADHVVLIWNRALEELTGVKAEDIVGTKEQWRPFYPSVRPCLADIVLEGKYEEAPDFYSGVIRSRLIPEAIHGEGDYTFSGRNCHLVFSATPIRDRDGRVIAALEMLEDATERMSLEAQLYHAQKMESVGALAGGVVHDFNNVLTVISGYADLLKMTIPQDEESQTIAREISASVERASDMTRSLLAFSGKHDVQLHFDDLNQILAVIGKSLGRLIREDIELTISLGEGRIPVIVDRVQIEQVLINLVVNARDAVKSNGIITVSTNVVQLEKAHVEGNTVIPSGQYACLTVGDNGSGISAENMEHIFKPFFTTKKMGTGTGLGLSIVQGIVSKHNGYVSVTTTPGNSTDFHVYLPLYSGEAPQVQHVEAMVPSRPGGGFGILVVEDDIATMRLHREVLSRCGYTVFMAADGVEGIEMFAAHRDEIRLALVDVIMPRMNGRDLVEQIRRQRPLLPIIMTSGYTDDIIGHAGIKALDVVFLQKPLRPTDMLSAIESCLLEREEASV
ncbi:MAG: PAS domain S-box protein [Desulfuromonadaceae bacterium]|nr:PAS domain S-box protein [Desulfuromonadaceae bacterium]MDD5104077.1 PAS domain S-box protein [Desulfuromonadaceae bacterium]